MKRRLDLGDGGDVVRSASPPVPVPQQQTTVARQVDLKGEQQLLVYTHYLSRLICPACKAHGMMTSRVNPVTTLFVCQQCLAKFEVDWKPSLRGTTINVDRYAVCLNCDGSGKLEDLVESSPNWCHVCNGYGRVKIPK